MATPMTADQFLRQLQKWGVRYVESSGWRTRNRNSAGAWGPVEGLLLHHTGDDAPDDADQKVLTNGRSDLPGPLCHWGMRDDGTAVLIGWGRANHAGRGAANVRAAVLSEDYGARPPYPGEDAVDGNALFYGQETMYSGAQAPTSAAYRNTVRIFAAVCDFHGWSGRSCIGHREWTSRKPDPGHLDMTQFRADVDALLEAGPGGDDMSADDVKAILDGVKELIAGTSRSYTAATETTPGLQGANLAEIGIVGARHAYAAETLAKATHPKLDALGAAITVLAGQTPDVDEDALALKLAPLLAAQLPSVVGRLSTEDIQAIAEATNDELARRASS